VWAENSVCLKVALRVASTARNWAGATALKTAVLTVDSKAYLKAGKLGRNWAA
jgi:hypothetical protein